MYAIIYLNWSGSKEEFDTAWKSLKNMADKFDDLELVDIFIPSSEWNYAALIKFKKFEVFLKYVKKTREEPLTFFTKRGLEPPPKKLELLVDRDYLE